jgi:ketosteroid isomerase-like protein
MASPRHSAEVHVKLHAAALLLLLVPIGGAAAQPPGRDSASRADLHRTVARLDSLLFDAYNRCDLDAFAAFFAEDVEFYHDQTGLDRGRARLVEAVRNNICGKVRRDPEPGTLEVHPLRHYGAVQIGVHRFCDARTSQVCGENGGPARYVMLWQETDGRWLLTRVISFDHH